MRARFVGKQGGRLLVDRQRTRGEQEIGALGKLIEVVRSRFQLGHRPGQ